MQRGSYDDLRALVAVGQVRSFTKAAAKLGVSQSALSQTVRQLEARLGVRLLTRTTRSVSLTEAGERLMRTVEPRFEEIEAELSAVGELREKPAGTIRITAGEHAIETILWPKLANFLPRYPDIRVELITDYGLTDIVAERYDAGVRWGGAADIVCDVPEENAGQYENPRENGEDRPHSPAARRKKESHERCHRAERRCA
jgi:DNA-binding transcriptional LysR family regulator